MLRDIGEKDMSYLLQITNKNKPKDKGCSDNVQKNNEKDDKTIFLDIKSNKLDSFIQKTLNNNNDGSYTIEIIQSDDDEKIIAKRFKIYNNIKQVIIYNELKSGRPFSSVRILNSRLRELSGLEKEFNKPFYEFDEDNIQEYVNLLSSKGNTVHTISTKLSVIGRAVDELDQLLEENNLPETTKNHWKLFNRDRKKGSAALRESNEKQFITEAKLVNEIVPGADLELTIPILLVYKGLMMGTAPGTNELMMLKWEDFDGNKIVVKGKRARTIEFTNAEMKLINQYKENHIESSYVMSPNKRKRGEHNRPITRWTVASRIAQAAEDMGIGKRMLTEQNIRLSGQLNWILQEEVTLYGPNATSEQLNDIIYRSYIQFGETKEDMENMSKGAWITRKTRVLLNLKQFEKSVNK